MIKMLLEAFMDTVRIIPCLDVKGGRLVKGVNFGELKDVGDPISVAATYSDSGADELVFLDITATIEERKTIVDTVRKTIQQVSVPLTVGGGIKSLGDIGSLLNVGATRVSMNSAAVRKPELIEEAARRFGSERIVIAIDVVDSSITRSGFEVVTRGGADRTGRDALDWAREVEDRGAGQILPTSMDKDGTQEGYHIGLLKALTEAVNIPVIASGGAGKLEHLYEAVASGRAKALLVASMFHFGQFTIGEAKKYLKDKGIRVSL